MLLENTIDLEGTAAAMTVGVQGIICRLASSRGSGPVLFVRDSATSTPCGRSPLRKKIKFPLLLKHRLGDEARRSGLCRLGLLLLASDTAKELRDPRGRD